VSTALFHQIVGQILDALAMSIAGLVVAVLTQLLRRYSLNVSAQQEAQLRYFAERAVHVVEETVEQKGAAKLDAAAALLRARFPTVPIDTLEDTIHAELARQRADGANELFHPKARS
jgi:hypothetical protein